MFFPHFVGDVQTIVPLTTTRREYACDVRSVYTELLLLATMQSKATRGII
jgi:hypothetical protein